MLEFHTLDVFTDTPYTGNPLAVVLGADGLEAEQMQAIAREFNLSETIFVMAARASENTARVRIFTPALELPFAGHPTIGCAILLANKSTNGDFDTVITLEQKAGLVPVRVVRRNARTTAEFTAPLLPDDTGHSVADGLAAQALDLKVDNIGFDKHKIVILQAGPDFIFVPLASRQALARARVVNPAWENLTKTAQSDSVFLYCRADDGFAARMFAPAHGMPEDPATGSAVAILAGQLHTAGELSEGKNNITVWQGQDMGRTAAIALSIIVRDAMISEIRIAGSAVHISSGRFLSLPAR